MSIVYMLLIGSNLIILNLQTILNVFGLTIPLNVAYIHVSCCFGTFYFLLLTIINITWLKYLNKFFWKSVRPLDEGFIVSLCTLNNSLFSTLLTTAWIQSNGGKFLLWTITDPFEWHMTYWIKEDDIIDNNYMR